MQEAEHHGDRWFKEAVAQAQIREDIAALTAAVKAEGIPLGATHTFPLGALTPDDEGELGLAVTATGGKVVIAFGKSIEWLGLTPRKARELADLLNKYAALVEAGKARR